MIKKTEFGNLPGGRKVDLYTLSNQKGMSVEIITFGAAVRSLNVPLKKGGSADVALGYETIQDYLEDKYFMGSIIGRYANRIKGGKFVIGEHEYQLDQNDGNNHLHGGRKGFYNSLWNTVKLNSSEEPSIELNYHSSNGEQGYPGSLTLSVFYKLTETNALEINYEGQSDSETILNPTSHIYFNLSGNHAQTILEEKLKIFGSYYTPVFEDSIPTGAIDSVKDTPFDFRDENIIGERIDSETEQVRFAGGYDHNWVLDNFNKKVRLVAELRDDKTNIKMKMYTDKPGLQFYSGNFLDDLKGKKGVIYKKRSGLCLEAQYYPDSPNKKHFPSPFLSPGAVYKQKTVYEFDLQY